MARAGGFHETADLVPPMHNIKLIVLDLDMHKIHENSAYPTVS